MSMDWFDAEKKRAVIRKQHVKPVCDTSVFGDTLVQQNMKDECDINNIMRRYEKTGLISHVNRYPSGYGDFTDVVDYRTACDIVIRANEMFMTLPSSVRARFENDPSKFLSYVDDPKNADELVKLGLARVRDKSDTDRIVDAISATKVTPEPSPK